MADTPRAQLLAYLQSITGTHTLIGQTSTADCNEFNADTQAFGFSPAIMFQDPWVSQWAGNAPFNAGFMPAALAHVRSGGIFGMSMILPNPVDGGPSMGGPAVDPVQLLTPGSALNSSLNRELDQAAGLLQQFKEAGYAVLTRFMMELDGSWFWYGDGHFSNAQQTQLFRYIVNYLRVTKGLDNLLTTFAVNGGPGDYEYPGNDVVDIVGIDTYTNNLAGTYKGIYDQLMSQAPTKLFALTETGSGDPSSPDRSYDENRLKSDIQSALPRTVYANFWSGWGPNLQPNGMAAMSDPFWINKSQVSVGGGVIVEPPQPVTPITFGTGPDSLVLEVCDDAYANGDGTSNANGDATFTISIDGKQIGGTFTTIASHAAGQDQDLTLNGYFGPGTHSVSVNFLNDAYNNTPSTDRNLYVDSVTYKGVNTNQAGQLLSAGAKGFTVSGGTSEPPPIQPITFGTGPDSLVLEVCDDAYANGDGTSNANGDATFTVSIDGKQIGGTFTTTASHAAGQDQDLTLNGYFGPGTHSVSVNFLNDAYNNTPSTDRNLYVDSVTYKWMNTNQAGQFLSAGAQAFTVSGGTSVNTVTGGTGNDTLNGGVGNDTLTGLGGNDILNGGAGADTMVGGAGNDIYFVDNAADVVNEAAGGGNDDILTKINYVLAAGTEVEGLRANAGATGLTLTGNEFNNILVGNVGNDTLLGGAGNDAINGGVGADTMAGGIGNDTYFVDNAADVVNETAGQGTDTVMTSVNYALTAGSEIEFLRANAGASGLALTGNALVNRLVGGAGNDTLNGGAGNDSLGGGAGNDVFKFLAGFGQDTITDFAAGPAGSQDLIDISGLGITAATFAANVHTANGGGGSTMVSFGGSANSIRLLNVAPANFDVTDCKLA